MMDQNSLSKLAILDIETSGPNFVDHQLLSVAILPMEELMKPLEIYVRPHHIEWTNVGRQYFESYKKEWQSRALPSHEACMQLVEYAQSTFGGPFTIAAHNVTFDFAFLRTMFHRAGVDERDAFSHRALDTHSLLYALVLKGILPNSVLNSSGAFDYFGIQVSTSSRHTAMGDAHATRLLLHQILQLF